MGWADLLRTPGDADIVWRIMESLIPSGQATGFSVALGIFSATMILFASVFCMFLVVFGIVSSAYSGKVLGDKYHQIWAPLRICFGFGMMVPLAYGFSSVHYLMKDVAFKAGVNMGNTTAVAAVRYIAEEGHPLAPVAIAGRTLARQVVISEICHAVYHVAHYRSMASHNLPPLHPAPEPWGSVVVKPGQKSWLPWGEGTPSTITGYSWDYGQACGAFTLSAPSTEEFGSFSHDRREAVAELIKEIRQIGAHTMLADHFRKSGTAMRHDPTRPPITLEHMDNYVVGGVMAEDLLIRLNEAGDKFDIAIAASAAENGKKEDKEARKAIVHGIKEHGWYILGSYYRTLSRLSEKSSTYAAERPVRIEPNPDAWGAYHNEIAVALDLINGQLRTEAHRLVVSGSDLADIGTDASLLARLINGISGPVLGYMTAYDGWRIDPVGDLINIGNRLLIGSQTGFAVGLAASGVAASTSTIAHTAMKVFDFAMVPGWWLIGVSYIAGAVLTYILPMMPLIFLTFSLVVLAMEIVAFSVSGPLWMLRHVTLSGDDFMSQESTPGYQVLFSLTLRQPITVLGFLGASAVSVAVFNAFLMVWHMGFVGNQGSSSIGLTGVLIGFAMMIYVQWHIQLRLYGLILELPTRVAAIMGAHIQGWGDQGHGDTVIAGSAGGMSSHGRLGKPQGSPKGDKPKTPTTNSGTKKR